MWSRVRDYSAVAKLLCVLGVLAGAHVWFRADHQTDRTPPQQNSRAIERQLARQLAQSEPRSAGSRSGPLTETPGSARVEVASHPAWASVRVAENGSYYGEPNENGVPKTVHVEGYYRRDGTYVRGHYRSLPYSNPPASVEREVPRRAENGSYYGQLNQSGEPKTVYVEGYYRRDGTYVRGHYRSR